MLRADSYIVEEAEAHRRFGLCVVAGRTYRAEGVAGAARHDLVDRMDDGAGGAKSGFGGARRHRGVGVDAAETLGRGTIFDAFDMRGGVNAGDLFMRGAGRLGARQQCKLLGLQRA